MARGEGEIVVLQLLTELENVETGRFGAFAVELDEHLFLHQPVDGDAGHPVDPLDRRHDFVLDQVPGIFDFGVDGDAKGINRDIGVVRLADLHPVEIVRHPRFGPFESVAHLAVGHVHVDPAFEGETQTGAPRIRGRKGVLQARDRRKLLFERFGDLLEHLLRRCLLPIGEDGHHRRLEAARQHLERDGEAGDRTNNQDAEQQDQHGDPPSKRQLRQQALTRRDLRHLRSWRGSLFGGSRKIRQGHRGTSPR